MSLATEQNREGLITLLCRYCEADDRWVEAVKFLDLDDGAGWQLLQACFPILIY